MGIPTMYVERSSIYCQQMMHARTHGQIGLHQQSATSHSIYQLRMIWSKQRILSCQLRVWVIGRLFIRKLCHEAIQEGGTFSVRSLNDGAESKVEFPKRSLNRFNKVQEAKEEVYNVPNSKTFRTVDSLVPPRHLFQMTVSTAHSINEGGLDSMSDILFSCT